MLSWGSTDGRGFFADRNEEGQVMLPIHNVNLVHRFMGCILKEKKIKTVESRIECIVIWLR